jgi:hypothetical protein
MRIALDLDPDVLHVARQLAAARRISLGKALAFLARRGAAAQISVLERDGFGIFGVGPNAAQFSTEDVHAALNREDRVADRQFVAPER